MTRSAHNDPELLPIAGKLVFYAVGLVWLPLWLIGAGTAAAVDRLVSLSRRKR